MHDNFFKDIKPALHESVGVNIENAENDKIIHEAIILDMFNGNMDALHEFYNHIGKYGARDSVLNESAVFDNQLHILGQEGMAKTSAILCIANESADPDYDLYTKSMLLMEAAMNNMKKKYDAKPNSKAEERLEKHKKIVAKNPRIQDALNKVYNSAKNDK